MILSLDHQQRLNLIALTGLQRGNVAEVRMFCSLQERLDLNEEEKRTIEYRVATGQNGMEQPSWNPELSLPARDFEVSETEGQRLRKVVEEYPYFLTAVDRKWIFNLLDQLPEAAPAQVPASPQGMPAAMR